MAHCNRVQKLFFSFFFFKLLLLFLFFLSSNDPPRRAAAAADPPSPFTEKPEPNTGCCRPQKTNALQPLLDRYETPTVLEKLETLPKTNCQTASASLEKGGVWPAKAAMSVPSRHAEFGSSFRPLLGTKKFRSSHKWEQIRSLGKWNEKKQFQLRIGGGTFVRRDRNGLRLAPNSPRLF